MPRKEAELSVNTDVTRRAAFFVIEPETVSYDGDNLRCVVHVKNMGKKSGKAVIQVYIGKPGHKFKKSTKELVGLEESKELGALEEQEIIFLIPKKQFASYQEEDASYCQEKGRYQVFIGDSVKAPYCGEFTV